MTELSLIAVDVGELALILSPLVVAWGSWLTWLTTQRSAHQTETDNLLDQHTAEIARLRAEIQERDRIASDTWREMINLRRRVVELEIQLHAMHSAAVELYGQVIGLGAIPNVTPTEPMFHSEKEPDNDQ